MGGMMKNPREKYDVLWELAQAAILFGRETEKLKTERLTIEEQTRAFDWFRRSYAKALSRLDTIEDPLGTLIRRGAEDGYYSEETPSNYLSVLSEIRKGERN